MTPTSSEALATVLTHTWQVLLDFDGPVCPIFAGGRNATIAGRMRHTLDGERVEVPDEVAATVDPLDVLWFAHKLGRPDLTHRVEDTFIAGEIDRGYLPDRT